MKHGLSAACDKSSYRKACIQTAFITSGEGGMRSVSYEVFSCLAAKFILCVSVLRSLHNWSKLCSEFECRAVVGLPRRSYIERLNDYCIWANTAAPGVYIEASIA